MKKILKIVWLLFISFFLISCIQTQAIENIGIINAAGVDGAESETESNLIETTMAVFQFTTEAEENTKTVSGKGTTIKGAVKDAEMSSIYKLVPGKIKLMLFGEVIAEKGFLPFMDTLARDPRVPDLMYIGVAHPNAKEILMIEEENISTDVGQFLHGIIEHHSNDHNIPRKTLQDFLHVYYDIGHDNILPIFEIVNDVPKHSKNALFQGDKVVGELSQEEITLVNMVERTVKDQLLELSIPMGPFAESTEYKENGQQVDEFEVGLNVIKSTSKTKLKDINNLEFTTDIKIQLRLVEQTAEVAFKSQKSIKLLEKEVKKNLENHLDKLLKKTQELEADPFGYGRHYRKTRQGKDLTNDEWREKFPDINVKYNLDIILVRHGAID